MYLREMTCAWLYMKLNARGSPVLKALSFQNFQRISAAIFAEHIQFWQDPNTGGPEFSKEKN